MKLPKIKTRAELASLFKLLDKQGFYYHNPLQAHNKKLVKIVIASNKLDMTINEHELADSLWRSAGGSYVKFERLAKEYFSKHTTKDKIRDLLRSITPATVREVQTEFALILKEPRPAEFSGYEITLHSPQHRNWRLYDLTGESLKLKHGDKISDVEKLIRLTIAKKFRIKEERFGQHQESDGVRFKIFKNGIIRFSHKRISKLRLLYKQYLLSWPNNAVKY